MNAKPATEKQINYINDLIAKQLKMLAASEFQTDYALMQRIGVRENITSQEASELIAALRDVTFAYNIGQFQSGRRNPNWETVFNAIVIAPEISNNETSDNDYWFAQDTNEYPSEKTVVEVEIANKTDEKIAATAKTTIREIIDMIQSEQARTWIDMHTTAVFFAFPAQLKQLLSILDKYTLGGHDYVLPDAVTELQALIPQFTAQNVVHG